MLLTKNEQAQLRANIDATAIAANPLTCGALLALLDIVARLPHTADGVPVICDGMTVYCPKGHAKKLTHATHHVYCCGGECWDDGCQGDSGSGTSYPFSLCRTCFNDEADDEELLL